MTGTAVKVTDVPAHMAPAGMAEMLTLAGRLGLTVMVTAFDVAGLPITQLALEVNTQVTMSLLANVLLVYVALLGPTTVPLSFH